MMFIYSFFVYLRPTTRCPSRQAQVLASETLFHKHSATAAQLPEGELLHMLDYGHEPTALEIVEDLKS